MNKPKTSTDGTKYVLNLAEQTEARLSKALAELESANELSVEVGYGPSEKVEFRGKTTKTRKSVTVKVVKGAKYTWSSGSETYEMDGMEIILPDGTKKTLRFEDEYKRKHYVLTANLDGVRGDISFFKQKIAEFKG